MNDNKTKSNWGLVTGIRPVKLLRDLVNKNGREDAIKYFKNELLVSNEKTKLSVKTMDIEDKILKLSKPESFSLYVSIPFCPSRCSYCSFVSQSIEKAKKLIPEYIDLLCEELIHTSKIVKDLKLKLETVYIGGGTPTTLDHLQLQKIISTINKYFDMHLCREFTVEAGRPDTITKEKLNVLKLNGVNRISINPQTLNDSVLKEIGRKHTVNDVLKAYELARDLGFNNINMDLIIGLSSDDLEKFKSTINKIIELSPENITVHALAMKRASRMNKQGKIFDEIENLQAEDMLNFSQKVLIQNKYNPYYLYRQKNMIGDLENVGWTKEGYEGMYNIFIMDEIHTIVSCGAGAVTKMKEPYGNRIERIFNFKFPYEYIDRFDEILKRKEFLKNFYIN